MYLLNCKNFKAAKIGPAIINPQSATFAEGAPI
jgi:hypothetical protein